MYLKLTRAFCFGGLAYRQNCNVFPAMPAGRRLEVNALGPISSNLMSSKNLTSSNNAANQINLNYSIHATEVESLLGKTFEMRGQPLQCIWLLPTYSLCLT